MLSILDEIMNVSIVQHDKRLERSTYLIQIGL